VFKGITAKTNIVYSDSSVGYCYEGFSFYESSDQYYTLICPLGNVPKSSFPTNLEV